MRTARLHVIRHGRTDWNQERRIVGHADIPLSREGMEQARVLARTLETEALDRVVSSDLLRCRQTAETIATHLHQPFVLDGALREIDEGDWTGLTEVEIQERWPDIWQRRWTAARPGGEHPRVALDRALQALSSALRSHDGRTIGVVTHQGIARLLAWRASGQPWRHIAQVPGLLNCGYVTLRATLDRAGKLALERDHPQR